LSRGAGISERAEPSTCIYLDYYILTISEKILERLYKIQAEFSK
jgi:hypothetical protein